MEAVTTRSQVNAQARLLCPRCRSRLPIAGDICLVGQVGFFCRTCKATIIISVEVVLNGEEGSPNDGEPGQAEGESR